eukprot:CAMPEP_0175129724 /NCGR_PEP_ID=MMETSP0087-20121206/5626_1 /TAXON_ID=136419 /ORGANISM="Unknown Unknown, Strain D1" /LENGTH=362 /DNA_ID=CAMNT_0016411895 /DNA_START=8 /DNA_END=1096 /DNA_ORIENTATION=-
MEPSPGFSQLLESVIYTFVMKLKRREIQGSGAVSTHTAELLRTVVAKGKYTNVQDLLNTIKWVGKSLSAAQPMELSIGNIVRRVLFIIRHECAVHDKEEKTGVNMEQIPSIDLSLSLHKLLDNTNVEPDSSKVFNNQLKGNIIEEVSELINEVKNVYLNISEHAVEHIYGKEVILTFGISRTVLNFLKEAGKFGREFEVIVAESAPAYEGQKMAVQLAQLGIETTVVTDSAVFAMMAHVNKVIIGVHGVMANGGLIAHSGAYNVAVAAKHHSVPFVVVTGLHKLCPLYAFDQDTFNVENAPSQILKFEDEEFVSSVNVMNPGYDYIEPSLVTLFITNFGGYSPSYIYRLLAEYYDPQDYELD